MIVKCGRPCVKRIPAKLTVWVSGNGSYYLWMLKSSGGYKWAHSLSSPIGGQRRKKKNDQDYINSSNILKLTYVLLTVNMHGGHNFCGFDVRGGGGGGEGAAVGDDDCVITGCTHAWHTPSWMFFLVLTREPTNIALLEVAFLLPPRPAESEKAKAFRIARFFTQKLSG